MTQQIIDLSRKDAKKFLLNDKSYSNLELPEYFTYSSLLNELEKKINNFKGFKKKIKIKGENRFCIKNFKEKIKIKGENRFCIKIHKGNDPHAYRTISFIHPVIYILLVKTITEETNWSFICERLKKLIENVKSNITCCSLISIPEKNQEIVGAQITQYTKFKKKCLENSLRHC